MAWYTSATLLLLIAKIMGEWNDYKKLQIEDQSKYDQIVDEQYYHLRLKGGIANVIIILFFSFLNLYIQSFFFFIILAVLSVLFTEEVVHLIAKHKAYYKNQDKTHIKTTAMN